MRIEACVTSISWIPFASIEGFTKIPFEMGIFRYDDPPLRTLRNFDRNRTDARFVNDLRAWITVEGGQPIEHTYAGGGHVGQTKVCIGPEVVGLPGVELPVLRRAPEVRDSSVRFVQSVGGCTALPAPRRGTRKPFFRVVAPAAWTTLALTIHADGSSDHELVGASPFPRHWIYDKEGTLVQKSTLIDFKRWYHLPREHTPWGEADLLSHVCEAETPLEYDLSFLLTRGPRKPPVRKVSAGFDLVSQGDSGREMFLLRDGVITIHVDGIEQGEVGPGAILGERAYLEGGRRKATLRAATTCRVAVASPDVFPREALEELAVRHGRSPEIMTLASG